MANKKSKLKNKYALHPFHYPWLYNTKYKADTSRNKNYNLGGYFTVEMSLLFPIILSVILILIFIMFYLHGRVILSEHSYVKGSNYTYLKKNILEDKGINGRKVNIVKDSSEYLLGYWKGSGKVSIEEKNRYLDDIHINSSFRFTMPFIFFEEVKNYKLLNYNLDSVNPYIKPVKLIRDVMIAKKILNNIGDYKKNKNK